MLVKDVLRSSIMSGSRIVHAYLDDLDDAHWKGVAVDGMNPIAWQIGHLIATENAVIEAIAPGSCPPLPEGFAEAHPRDPAKADPSKFPARDEYLKLWDAQNQATLALIDKLDESQLAAEAPERMKRMCKTVAETIGFMGGHTLMHVGQFVCVRRKAGRPVAV